MVSVQFNDAKMVNLHKTGAKMSIRIIILIFAVLSLGMGPLNARAQEEPVVFKCNKEEIPKITITQTAKIESEPDKAVLDLRITIEETKIERAYQKNTEKMNQVIDIFKSHGVEKKDIKTTAYQITPLYEGKPLFSKVHRPTSYTVSHDLSVNVFKLDSIGDIVGQVAEIESVNLESIDFTSTKLEDLKKEAFKKAAQSAHDLAMGTVSAAGGKLGKVLKIEQNSPGILRQERQAYLMKEAMALDAQAPAQIESGTLTIEAVCTVTYEILSL